MEGLAEEMHKRIVGARPAPGDAEEARSKARGAVALLEKWAGEDHVLLEAFYRLLDVHVAAPDWSYPLAFLSRCVLCAGYRHESVIERAAAERAYDIAEKGLELDPSDYECILAKATAVLYKGDAHYALQLASYLASYHAQRPEAHLLIAEIYAVGGQPDAGASYLNFAAGAAAGTHLHPRAQRALGSFHLRRGDHASALGVYEALLRIVPDDPWVLHNSALCLGLAGRFEEAEKRAARAAELVSRPETEHLLKELRRKMERKREEEEEEEEDAEGDEDG